MSNASQQENRENIVLIGFMGTGKSSVGRRLASRLGFDFFDTDAEIVAQSGRSISVLFAEEGEPAFRQRESALLRSLRGRARLILATGGGIVVAPENLGLLKALGFVVWLEATEETIMERVSRNQRRPLLQTADPRATIHALLTARRPLYGAAADCQIATGDRSHDEVAHAILAAHSAHESSPAS